MAKELEIKATCPKCKHTFYAYKTIDHTTIAPRVKSDLIPDHAILQYTITTEDMTLYLTEQIHMYSPDAKVEVVPFYCEKKHHKGERHCSYASLRIALSGKTIMHGSDDGSWYSNIGNNGSANLNNPLLKNIVNLYKYDRNTVSRWMNYKTLDQLEEKFGITESYLYDLRNFADPQAVKANDGSLWVIFAADPTLVINNMLTDVTTQELPGTIKIMDIRQVNKDILEYQIQLWPAQMKSVENPHVRTLLTGGN